MDMTLATLTPQVGDSTQMLLARMAMANYGRSQSQVLASAARTATTQTSDLNTLGARGIIVVLNITAASGTGGLQIRVRYKDTILTQYVLASAALTPSTTIGLVNHQYGEGIGSLSNAALSNGGVASGYLTETTRVEIFHVDASSYTYSVNIVIVK